MTGIWLRAPAFFIAGFWAVLCLAEEPLGTLVGPEAELVGAVNSVRSERHLLSLRGSPELARVALAHAEDMARHGYLAHEGRDGRNPLQRTQDAGVQGFRLLAENIGSSNVPGNRIDAVVRAWLESPVHRENVLNPAFNSTGVGLARTPGGHLIAVQLYATF